MGDGPFLDPLQFSMNQKGRDDQEKNNQTGRKDVDVLVVDPIVGKITQPTKMMHTRKLLYSSDFSRWEPIATAVTPTTRLAVNPARNGRGLTYPYLRIKTIVVIKRAILAKKRSPTFHFFTFS